jgi:hypothetical protein
LKPEPAPDKSILEEPPDAAELQSSDTLLINAAKGSRPNPLPQEIFVKSYLKTQKVQYA